MKLDILAIGAHPDDVELSCSGTLMLHKRKGYRTGVLDLTEGELGSRGDTESRRQESRKAAEILQLDVRENMGFRDGFFRNDEEHQRKLMTVIRRFRPDIILANAPRDRHPDHGRGAELIRDTCYLSGLLKIETEWDGQPQEAWRPKRVFHYMQDQYLEPDFIIDITATIEAKKQSIMAYGTQFLAQPGDGPMTYIATEDYINRVLYRNALMGKKIGTAYGEGFLTLHYHLGLTDFDGIILPELV